MKINKKILIPVFATAMGLSAIGGISGAVAWYQYNTKAEASWVGASVADGGRLLISENGSDWERSIIFDKDVDDKTLHPCTFPTFDGSAAPENGKKHPKYGQEDSADWMDAVEGTDYFQYTFHLKAQKIVNNAYTGVAAAVKIKEFVLDTDTESAKSDAAHAVRVHMYSSAGSKLYALDAGTTTCSGALDLNGDTKADYHGGYAWDTDFDDEYVYGNGNSNHTAVALANDVDFITIPADGAEITLTIWMEGWHSYSSTDMSMWSPATTGGAPIRFGVTFGVAEDLFIDETI